MQRRNLLALAGTGLAAAMTRPASAQGAYPDRPIRFIVPFPPGGCTDVWARITAEGMQPELGQPIIIENRGGAGGLVGTEAAAKAVPDGYTLLFTITTHVQTPVVMRRFPYDPINDFAPIGRLGTTSILFCVGPAVPASVTTMDGFRAWARGRDLSLGSYAPGSTGHAFALMLAQEAELQMTHVGYRGETPMLQDMLAGQIHGGFHSMAAAGEMMKAGRVRPLGASGTERVPSMPGVPTMKELGFSDRFAFTGFLGLLAPARTPAPILRRLAEAFRVAAQKPETIRRLLAIDTVPAYQDPDAFRAQIARSLREWTEIANALDLRIDG